MCINILENIYTYSICTAWICKQYHTRQHEHCMCTKNRLLSWREPFKPGLDVSGNRSKLVFPTLAVLDSLHYLSSAYPKYQKLFHLSINNLWPFLPILDVHLHNFHALWSPRILLKDLPFLHETTGTLFQWKATTLQGWLKDLGSFPSYVERCWAVQWKNRKQPGDVNSGKMGVHKGQKKTWHLCTSKGDLKASWCSKVGVTADSQHLKSSSTSLAFQQDWFMGSFRLVICNLLAFGNQSAKKRTFPGKA